ncbi:hypothetical protein EV702DRAFT_1253481 [Suillus placidus]|uniref:Uncharacterized protein n=1 Tax=Suillus placidus TaxID=48579 RepID=A0A9P6ZL09_9AGAM|nr:hypothetical protein EV702DRAFT_1253481 [Suillus placidus]
MTLKCCGKILGAVGGYTHEGVEELFTKVVIVHSIRFVGYVADTCEEDWTGQGGKERDIIEPVDDALDDSCKDFFFSRLFFHLQNGTKSNSKSEDAAFSTDEKGKGESRSRSPMSCFNCSWRGHKKENCWEEGKRDKASKDEKPKPDSAKANTTTRADEPNCVWLAMAVDAGDINEVEEGTLKISAPQLQADEDIHTTTLDSGALAQKRTAAEGVIVE